jgi:glyoxylase-like metal-dependent hydrolase (beta-lactamase superfamily II)
VILSRLLPIALVGLFFGALAAGRLAAEPRTFPPPVVKVENVQQISPHVYVIPDDLVPQVSNIGFIVGETGILVIDTGLGPRNGAAIAAVAQKLGGSRAQYLVTTHFHPEHDLGAQGFPATTKLIRSTDQIKDIAQYGLQLANLFVTFSPAHAELLKGADFRKADSTFEMEYDLDLGGVRARLIALGPNHTRGDTGIWLEADRVLFAGDVVMTLQPAFNSPEASLRQWLSSLDRLEALKPALIVPSHGPNGDAGLISGYRAYLTEVRDRTAAEKRAGRSVDQAVESVTVALTGRFPDRNRLAGAIKSAYAEAP